MFYEVIPIKLFRKNAEFLTYASDFPLKPGQIIKIPLGKSSTIGIVSKKTTEPDFSVKKIESVLYEIPLPGHILKSIFWLSDYYLIPLPTAASLFLPKGISKNRRKKPTTELIKNLPKSPKIPLNPAQKQALEALRSANKATILLHGVTGSGKTNIYLKMASECLKSGKSVILLVPEIALTSQLVQIFENTFENKISLIHSEKTEAERHKIWEKILESNESQIIIGPRSALLSPVNNLGLIIIDEAHESTFFQENSPKYSALRLASFIAKTKDITCLLGTATPKIEDYYLAKSNNSLVSLSEKAKKTTPLDIGIIDLKDKMGFRKNSYFSDALLNNIKENLEKKRQTLIFHNRRGSAPLTICKNCGWQALCPHCFLPLTLHADEYLLFCHTCSFQTKIPSSCPECGHSDIIHKGFGTKLLENELKKLYKTASIARFDGDNNKSNSLNNLYDDVKNGKIDILIGTQSLAKGLDLKNLATVGIVQADSGLSLPDYSAEERTFELLTQVIGRVGRGHLDTASVFIQTYNPENPIIKYALSADYENFYNFLLTKRKKQNFPPFSFLAKLTITLKTEALVIKKTKSLYTSLLKNSDKKVSISTPSPAFHEHTASGYTWQIILKSRSRNELLRLVKTIDKNLPLHIILDPPSLL